MGANAVGMVFLVVMRPTSTDLLRVWKKRLVALCNLLSWLFSRWAVMQVS